MNQIEQKLDLLLKEVAGIKNEIEKQAVLKTDKPLSVEEAAAYLKLSPSRIYTLVYAQQLQPNQRKKRSRITFSIKELNNYLQQSNISTN